ncbi:VWA domain-containing protein [Methyloglobulus sp.]|uniref:VWA domain-containing protein n=1 Tax=Methyloglobulus sp. TaxID=2518622 RepID=UPI0032B7F9CE
MTLSEFHFIRPYLLLALLPYAILLVMLVRSKLSHGNWAAVCDEALLPYLLQDKAVAQSRWPLVMGSVAALFAIIALAGPTWERLPTPVFRNDSALVIVLDLSRSMDAADIKPSRLVMARYKIADILKQRKDGQTALLVYAGDAFTVTPLTNDTDTIDNQLSALTTEIMPRDGNNMARALEKAEVLFKQAGLQKGQLLLLTDGGNIDDALSKAKSLDAYQLLVLGVGTSGGAPIALETGGFLKDEQGSIVVDKLNVNELEKLARAGQGAYQSLTADDADIQALLSTMTSQSHEKGEKNENLLLDQWRDVGPWLLLLVLPLAALSFRKGLLGIALFLVLPFPKNSYAIDMNREWHNLWQTKDQQAQETYNNQQYDKAAELFENPDWKAAAHYKSGAFDKVLENLKNNSSANSLYNQGNALAQSGQLQEALDAYKKALKLNPDDNDTLYNKDLVEKELEKQKQEQKQDQKQQDQDKKKDSQDEKNQQQNKDGDKSGQPEQDKNQEKQDEQKEADKKPEQKSEQSQESAEQQPEKKEAEKQEQENQPEVAKPEQTDPKKEDKKPDAASTKPLDAMTNEEKQANEQWLKRIPDDPAGLLRRKFKYQYDQRGQQ